MSCAQRAAALGVSVPRLMVEAALEGRQTPTERRNEIAALFEIRRLLATVANNVNQLARSANIAGQVSERRGSSRRSARSTSWW